MVILSILMFFFIIVSSKFDHLFDGQIQRFVSFWTWDSSEFQSNDETLDKVGPY